MAKNHTRYIFSMGELKRKDNSIAFSNEKGNFYLPIEETRELYCLNEVSFNTKFLDFIAKAGITMHIFNYHGGYSGSFYPKEYLISGELTIKQSLAYVENRLTIAKSIVSGIAANIHETLSLLSPRQKRAQAVSGLAQKRRVGALVRLCQN